MRISVVAGMQSAPARFMMSWIDLADVVEGNAQPTSTTLPVAPQSDRAEWIRLAGVVLAALVAGLFGLWQLRRSQKATRELERQNRTFEQQLEGLKHNWELDKIRLQHQLEDERTTRDARQKEEERRRLRVEKQDQQAQTDAREAGIIASLAEKYRRQVTRELRDLKILDMASPLDLERIYVQVRIREGAGRRFVAEQDMEELSKGEPLKLLKTTQAQLAELSHKAMQPLEALGRFRRLVILGDPGAGKTTMLRYIALRTAQGHNTAAAVLPVYVELRRFIDSGAPSFVEFAASDWNARYGFPDAEQYIKQELDAGRATLLLDGLDEVLGGGSQEQAQSAYEKVANETNRVAARFPDATIAITCRKAGWRSGLPAFQTLEVLDFSWEQIRQFVNNWFVADPSRAEQLTESLAGNLRMQTLAANPLILSLIAIVFERDLELPERRAELYSRCVQVLLREWDTHRGIKRFSQFTTDRKFDLIEEIAWHFHREGRRYFPEDELRSVVASFLPTISMTADQTQDILDEITTQYGLLKEQAQGWYGFLHLTIQEYLTAVAVDNRGVKALQEVIEYRHQPWWEEVILLLAGRMSDATPLLLGVLGRTMEEFKDRELQDVAPEASLATRDDAFKRDLHLAGRCLGGTPRIRMAGLRERIVEDLWTALEASDFPGDTMRTALTLATIGTPDIAIDLLDASRLTAWESESESADAVFSALASTGKSAEAELVSRLQDSKRTYSRVLLVRALGKLRAKTALPQLRAILEYEIGPDADFDYGYVGSAIDAIVSIDDRSLIPWLQQLTEEQPDTHKECRILLFEGIAALWDPSNNEDLASYTWVNYRRWELGVYAESSTKSILSSEGAQSLVPAMLEALRDEALSWKERWALTEVLESHRPAAEHGLASVIRDEGVDVHVRAGIAATMARWGDESEREQLVRALSQRIVELNLEDASQWLRIARVLKEMGDGLPEQLLMSTIRKRRLADLVLFLAGELRSVAVTDEGLRRLAKGASLARRALHRYLYLRSTNPGVVQKENLELALAALEVLMRQYRQLGATYLAQTLVVGIGRVAADEETVSRILEVRRQALQFVSGNYGYRLQAVLKGAMHEALYEITGRANLWLDYEAGIERRTVEGPADPDALSALRREA